MATYIVFYQQDQNGDVVECVGGDSAFRADGRLSIDTIMRKIRNKEYCVPKSAIGFKLEHGTSHLNRKPFTKLLRFDEL